MLPDPSAVSPAGSPSLLGHTRCSRQPLPRDTPRSATAGPSPISLPPTAALRSQRPQQVPSRCQCRENSLPAFSALFPIACSRMPDAGLARTRTALLLPRWGFHVTCWEASLSSPFRHSADLLFSVLRHSPSEGSFPLPGRPSLAASRAFWAPRLPRPSEGGHRGDFKAPSSPCFSPLPPRSFYPFHLCFSFRRFFLLTIGH